MQQLVMCSSSFCLVVQMMGISPVDIWARNKLASSSQAAAEQDTRMSQTPGTVPGAALANCSSPLTALANSNSPIKTRHSMCDRPAALTAPC